MWNSIDSSLPINGAGLNRAGNQTKNSVPIQGTKLKPKMGRVLKDSNLFNLENS